MIIWLFTILLTRVTLLAVIFARSVTRGEAIQLRATIEGLKEEIVSWSNAYKAMQKKHSAQIDRLIQEFNDRESKLKSQVRTCC